MTVCRSWCFSQLIARWTCRSAGLRVNLPEDANEYVIDGGNHSGFGYYGQQKGDHVAGISPKEQQEAVVDALCYNQ